MAWQIVKHAFVLIFNNFGQAVKVSIMPIALLIAIGVVLMPIVGVPLDALGGGILQGDMYLDSSSDLGVFEALFLTLFALLILFVVGWIAVSWHRFILLEEYTNVLPAVSGRPIWGYIGKSILLGLIMAGISIPTMLILGLSIGPLLLGENGSPFGEAIFGLVITTIIGFFWLRLAITLPAKAVGKEMVYSDAWAKTGTIAMIIFQVSAISAVFNIFAPLLAEQLLSAVPGLSFVGLVVINWITMMVGVSVLTTLYGHLVEGRPLVD